MSAAASTSTTSSPPFGSLRVDVNNSRTPYTDATQSKKPSNHIKRPMNGT